MFIFIFLEFICTHSIHLKAFVIRFYIIHVVGTTSELTHGIIIIIISFVGVVVAFRGRYEDGDSSTTMAY